MKLRWAALVTVLAFGALMPSRAEGQSGPPPGPPRRNGSLGQNYPNPFNPDTHIDFQVGDEACYGSGQRHRVTMRIYNLLAQPVAAPQVERGGQRLENLELECGSYTAYWDGKYQNSGRQAASSVYVYRIEIDGVAVATKRMFLGK